MNIFQDLHLDEFHNDPLNMNKRKALTFSDEYVFRKAKIYKCLGPGDDRLQVQVLPELQGIDDEEMEDLPKYPPWVKGQVITGKSHVVDGDDAEYVWCICTPDLQVGYIVAKANVFGKSTVKYEDSYSYRDVKSFLQQRRALPSDFDYNHIQVVQWVASDRGGMIQCYNYLTGDWVLLNTSGSIITVQQQKIYMRVGTPPNPVTVGAVAHSSITMTPDKIDFHAPTIEFDARNLILAHHGMKAAGCVGNSPSVDNGVPVIPASNVWL